MEELKARRGPNATVPFLFLNGQPVGDHRILTKLNEMGKLEELFAGAPVGGGLAQMSRLQLLERFLLSYPPVPGGWRAIAPV